MYFARVRHNGHWFLACIGGGITKSPKSAQKFDTEEAARAARPGAEAVLAYS